MSIGNSSCDSWWAMQFHVCRGGLSGHMAWPQLCGPVGSSSSENLRLSLSPCVTRKCHRNHPSFTGQDQTSLRNADNRGLPYESVDGRAWCIARLYAHFWIECPRFNECICPERCAIHLEESSATSFSIAKQYTHDLIWSLQQSEIL